MSSTDIGFWVATAAAAIAAFYAALGYHRPVGAPMAKSTKPKGQQPTAKPQPSGFNGQALLLILLAAISWGGALFAYYTRPSLAEYSISPDNADMDIRIWQKGLPSPDIPGFFVNAYTINRGKSAATNMVHVGSVVIGSSVDQTIIEALYPSLRAQLKLIPVTASASSIRPGQDTTWFSIFGPPRTDELSKAFNDGTQFMFVFNIMRYRDEHLAAGKFIYTESCLIFVKEVAHICDSGHNRTYISD
jgi:hypothetical protein